jgi:anthranilate synthase/aminodeoxychorismate synthase-like glutamine amidotransferase
MIKHDGKGIFVGTKNPLRATRYHSLVADKQSIPSCLKITAEAIDDHEIMGVRHKIYPIEGLQFHPESIMTEDGKKIIKNFLEGK